MGVTYIPWLCQSNTWNFNPHSHNGSDTIGFRVVVPRYYFNPHSHKGSDYANATKFLLINDFNPHSHKGSDAVGTENLWKLVISIHTPTRGVTGVLISHCVCGRFQSTLPQGEWLKTYNDAYEALVISIHTPTRGVTHNLLHKRRLELISIHTPTRGVTQSDPIRLRLVNYFNPHSHKGSDVVH